MIMPRLSFGVLLWWLLALPATASAQSFVTPVVAQRWTGPVDSRLGLSVAVGDLDRDGIPDLAAGGRGLVVLYSGQDGRRILTLVPQTPAVGFGAEVDVIGDATGDGVQDLIIADPGSRSAHLYSGTDGTMAERPALPYEVTNDAGLSIDGVGDVDGDGLADFVIARRGLLNGADVFSGASGEVLIPLDDDPEPPLATAATMGDLDGDGIAEVAIGYPFSTVIYSTATGLRQYSVPIADVVASADVDGDGRRDLLVNQGPDVFLFSSPTGAPIGSVRVADATPCCYLRVSIARLGDVDGDGMEDFAAAVANADGGAPRSGSVSIFSGATRARLARIDGTMVDEGLGWSLAGPGDVDGDGIPDLLVGAPGALDTNGSPTGALLLFRLYRGAAPIGVDILPSRCPNELSPRGSNAIEVALYGAPGLDLSQLDPSTVRLAGVPPLREHRRALDIGVKPAAGSCVCSSPTPDAMVDRTFVFGAVAVRRALTESADGRLIVTAALQDGRRLAGFDCATLDPASNPALPADEGATALNSTHPARATEPMTIETTAPAALDGGCWTIYDIHGRRIAGVIASGRRLRARWNGRDDQGVAVRPGVFFVRTGSGRTVRRVLILP